MGFYARTVFPCLCDLLLRQPFLTQHRRDLLASVCGDILEIGFGTGLNLPCYPQHIRKITAVDANPGMNRLAKRRMARTGIEVDHRVLDCARLPFGDHSFDCVVSTWTLCSIENVNQALAEVFRVLRPGARFLFLEHGLSPDPGVQKWQRRLNKLEMRLADGCHLDRNIKAIVAEQPFASVQVDEFYLTPFPKTHSYMYRGTGVK